MLQALRTCAQQKPLGSLKTLGVDTECQDVTRGVQDPDSSLVIWWEQPLTHSLWTGNTNKPGPNVLPSLWGTFR